MGRGGDEELDDIAGDVSVLDDPVDMRVKHTPYREPTSYRDLMDNVLNIIPVNNDQELADLVSDIRASDDRVVEIDMEVEFPIDEETGEKIYDLQYGIVRTFQVSYTNSDGTHRQAVVDMRKIEDSSPITKLLSDKSIQKRSHSSRFDQIWAIRDFGTPINNVFDTMAAWQSIQKHMRHEMEEDDREALVPGWKPPKKGAAPVSLSASVKQFFGFALPKGDQKTNWGREMTTRMRKSAATDVAVMGPLGDKLEGLLDELDPSVRRDVEAKIKRLRDSAEKTVAEFSDN